MKSLRHVTTIILPLLFLLMAGCAATDTREGTGEYIDDSVITAKVKFAILSEDSLKSAEINVETFKGVVQLSGFVTTKAVTKLAVKLAEAVKGVKSVKNDMRVK